jgi:hypothetical protein
VDGVNYTFDANGNLLNDGTNTYTYDSANRLTMVNGSVPFEDPSSTVEYAYRVLGDGHDQINFYAVHKYPFARCLGDFLRPISKLPPYCFLLRNSENFSLHKFMNEGIIAFLEKATPSRGGGAKSWVCFITDRQAAEVFLFGGRSFDLSRRCHLR